MTIPAGQIDDVMAGRLAALGCHVEPCGSRVTCTTHSPDADHDYLVQITRDREGLSVRSIEAAVSMVVELLHDAGFKLEGSEHYQQMAANDFMSWRRGDLNLIVTANAAFADRHRAATHVAKHLNLRDKTDRIALFQAVLYANKWDLLS